MELSVVLQQTGADVGELASRAAALGPALDDLGVDYEWILVGAASAIDSLKLPGRAPKRLVDISGQPFGKTLVAAFAAASGPFILTTVGPTDPADVAALWSKRRDADLLVGAPTVPKGLGRRLTNRLYRKALSLPYRDVVSGLRLYRREALARLDPNGTGVDILAELIVGMHVEGYKIREVGIGGASAPPGASLLSFAAAIARLRVIRRKRDAADAADRAFQSHVPLRTSWVRKRHDTVIRFLEVDVPFLDIGCGASRVVQTLSRGVALGRQPRTLRYLRYRAPAVVAGGATQLPFRDASFPQLVCVASRRSAGTEEEPVPFDEIKRVLRPGGTLVLGARDSSSWSGRMLGSLQGWVGPEDVSSAYATTEESLRRRLEDNGFSVDELSRVCGSEMICRAVRKN